MNKKISFLPGVIIGEWLPIDTLKLQQSSPLSGSDLEVTTAWSKRVVGGLSGNKTTQWDPQASHSVLYPAIHPRKEQARYRDGWGLHRSQDEKKKNPWA